MDSATETASAAVVAADVGNTGMPHASSRRAASSSSSQPPVSLPASFDDTISRVTAWSDSFQDVPGKDRGRRRQSAYQQT